MSRNLLPYGCLPKLEGFQEIHLKGMTRVLVRLEYNLALRSCHFQVPKIPTFKTKSQFLGEGASAHRLTNYKLERIYARLVQRSSFLVPL